MTYEWVWDGGRPSLDLINTLRDRKQKPYDMLREPADLATWLTSAGLLATKPPEVTPAELAGARQLREVIDAAIQAVVYDRPPKPKDVELINDWARHVPTPRLEVGDDAKLRKRQSPDPLEALARVAVDAIELLVSDDVRLVRVCGSGTCGLRFLDRSRARNRQWCSMARCGNREKARLHYARTKSLGSAT
ncbi:CGNR zinc finger domain-containing protein [Flindersiella endophytica]